MREERAERREKREERREKRQERREERENCGKLEIRGNTPEIRRKYGQTKNQKHWFCLGFSMEIRWKYDGNTSPGNTPEIRRKYVRKTSKKIKKQLVAQR